MAGGEDVIKVDTLNFRRQWTVQADTPHAGLKTVVVTVTPQRNGAYGGNKVARLDFLRER